MDNAYNIAILINILITIHVYRVANISGMYTNQDLMVNKKI